VTEVESFFGGGGKETTGTLVNSAAAVYNVAPNLRLGAEIAAESEYEEDGNTPAPPSTPARC